MRRFEQNKKQRMKEINSDETMSNRKGDLRKYGKIGKERGYENV